MMTPRTRILKDNACGPSKHDGCSQACDLFIIFRVDIREHGILPLPFHGCQHKLAIRCSKLSLTFGICSGRSTSFVIVFSPINGHSSSTVFFICSQRSASCLIKRIKPYLTTRTRYAPCSTFFVKLPLASTVTVLPLREASAICGGRCVR